MRLKDLGLVSLLTSALWMAVGCATPGTPLPPSLHLPRPVDDLQAERKGGRVVLSWSQPTMTTDRQNITRLGATRVCRAFRQFPMATCVELVKQLPLSDLHTGNDEHHEMIVWEDALPAGSADASAAVTYAIEVLNTNGRSAGFSNQVKVSLAPTLAPPADLKAEVQTDGVRLTWVEPPHEATSSSVRFHFRVFRRLVSDKPSQREFSVVDDLPLASGTSTLIDHSFEWEQTYEYKVTPISEVTGGMQPIEVQGEDSSVVKVVVHDIFPPEKPSAVQAVFSGAGQRPFIDLSWAPNSEADLAGYNVFRREGSGDARQVNRQAVKSPSFRDEDVQPGVTYIYAISAVDLRGNESARSEEARETVPKE